MSKEKGIFSKVVGVSFENTDGSSRQEAIENSKSGDILTLMPFPNEHDHHAIRVINRRTKDQLGYLKKELAQDVWDWMINQKNDWYAQITEITGTDDPNKTLGCNIYLEKIEKDEEKLENNNSEEELEKLKEQMKWEKRSEKFENAGQSMQAIGCILTLFLTIPIILFFIFML